MYWQSCWGGKCLVFSPVTGLQIHLRSGLKQVSSPKLGGNLVSRVILSWLLLKQRLPIQCDNENCYPLGAKLCPPKAWFPFWSTFFTSSWNCMLFSFFFLFWAHYLMYSIPDCPWALQVSAWIHKIQFTCSREMCSNYEYYDCMCL